MQDRFETFAISITKLNRYLQKIKEIEMKKLGLNSNHTMCLYYLNKYKEGLCAAQLVKYCNEDKAAISRTLSQLSNKKFITCKLPENKRPYRTLFYLTENGQIITEQINKKIEKALFNGSNGITDIQRTCFYDSIQIILNNLSQYIKECEEEK